MMLSCPTAIYLQPIEDPIGFGREWYRLEYVYCGPQQLGLQLPPVFHVEPEGTYFEQWRDDTDGDGRPEHEPGNLVWFTGPPGHYTVIADVPCGVHTKLSFDIEQ